MTHFLVLKLSLQSLLGLLSSNIHHKFFKMLWHCFIITALENLLEIITDDRIVKNAYLCVYPCHYAFRIQTWNSVLLWHSHRSVCWTVKPTGASRCATAGSASLAHVPPGWWRPVPVGRRPWPSSWNWATRNVRPVPTPSPPVGRPVVSLCPVALMVRGRPALCPD